MRRKKRRFSSDNFKQAKPKIVFYTEKIRIQLPSLKRLDYWLKKYPRGKYIVYEQV